MSDAAQELLRAFRTLPEPDQREVASNIFEWWARTEQIPLEDEHLVSLADEIFRTLDQREVSGGSD